MKISKATRERLARLASNPAELAKAMPVLCRASHDSPVLAVRAADGSKLSTEKRDELLAKAVAGEFVEVIIDVHAYDQKSGEQNRNFVRFRDGAMVSLGRTGKGTPFLRDHRQGDSLAVAGTVFSSATQKLGEGEYVIQQTVRITAPWAVDLALRGLIGAVSIGWNPTGPVMCSDCNAPIFTKCWHFPGDRLKVGEDGRKRFDDTGDIVVEWIYTEAELIETSIVPIGAVRTARIDEIRASLSLHVPDLRAALASGGDFSGEDLAGEKPDMKWKNLIAILGLAATATEEEVLAAAEKRLGDANTTAAELGIVQRELAVLQADHAKTKEEKRKAAEDKFIESALSSGRIAKGDEPAWRELYAASAERAEKLMADRQPNVSTPVNAPRQSATDPERQPGTAPIITGGRPRLMIALTDEDHTREEREKVFAELMANPRALHYAAKLWGLRGDGIPTVLGPTTISNNADLDAARVGFHAAFLTALEQKADDPTAELYTTVPSNGNLEEWSWLGDLPGFEEWKGERKLAGLEGYKLRVSNKDWSNGLRVKANDLKDDKLGLLPPQIAGLAMKARRHRWDMMVKLLANGFDGAVYPDVGNGLGYDGAFFFSDAHVTGSNKLTVALDAAGLSAAELKLESMTTYDGNDPMDVHGTHLIVGPKLRATAEKLLTQERLANGEDNYHRGKYKLIVSQRLRGTADDYWFLADLSSPIKPLLFQMREEISTSAQTAPDSEGVFARNEYRFGAQARYNVAYFEHRLVVGSQVA